MSVRKPALWLGTRAAVRQRASPRSRLGVACRACLQRGIAGVELGLRSLLADLRVRVDRIELLSRELRVLGGECSLLDPVRLVAVLGDGELGEPKTASSRRAIPIGASTIDALRAHRRDQAEERLRMGTAWQDGDFVFPSAVGTPLDGGNLLKNSYYPLLERIGLPRLTFHALRHTAATLLLLAGMHPKIVAERLGHSTTTVTAISLAKR